MLSITELPPDDTSDDACLDYLWRRNYSADGRAATCPRCDQVRHFRRAEDRPAYRCTSCGKHLHPTAGTIFHKSTTPLHIWFRAIRLVAGSAGAITAKQLERDLHVTYKTAWRMGKLIREQMLATNIDLSGEPTDPDAALLRLTTVGAVGMRRPDALRPQAGWAPGVISTFAGDGTVAYGGDGGQATAAQLSDPHDVVADGDGNVFIADSGNNVVRRVDARGVITTVAGCGSSGYSGDGGLAIYAELNGPTGVALDDAGNLVVVDHQNHVVRRVDPAGVITTVAGTGERGFSGDGGPAIRSKLDWPGRVVCSNGRLFISDYRNNRVRMVDENGLISTFAGNGSNVPSGDGGPAVEAGVVRPNGMAVSPDGSLLVAQPGDPRARQGRVRRITPSGTISTVAGGEFFSDGGDGGLAILAGLGNPTDVTLDQGEGFLIADLRNNRIRRVDGAGRITSVVGVGVAAFGGNSGSADRAFLNRPVAVATTPAGDLLIADAWNHRIRKVTGPLPWTMAAPAVRTSAG